MSMIKTNDETAKVIEQVLVMGDLARLTPEQRNVYYKSVCESVGLNPLTRPFEYITLNGKLTLYARKDCTDQLRKLHGVSIRIASRETVDGVVIITAQATDKSGRIDESTGAVASGNLRGEALANCWMKAETKAKRRVTLSLCGLGFVDESEIESIPNARIGEPMPAPTRGADRLLAEPVAQPQRAPEPVAIENPNTASAPESRRMCDSSRGTRWVLRLSSGTPREAHAKWSTITSTLFASITATGGAASGERPARNSRRMKRAAAVVASQEPLDHAHRVARVDQLISASGARR